MSAAVDADLRNPAQTTVQLYDQLRRCGRGDDDLRAIRAACAVARRIYAGAISDSLRPHLAHCVGTASLLTSIAAPAELITAAFLHSAYRRGDFGPWRSTLRQRRSWLRRQIGTASERLVYGFHRMEWSPEAVLALPSQVAELDSHGRDILLLRLANELESLSGGAVLYHPCAERKRREAESARDALVQLADAIDAPALGRALANAIDALAEMDVPAELRAVRSQVFAPESARRRLTARLTTTVNGAWRRLRDRVQLRKAPR